MTVPLRLVDEATARRRREGARAAGPATTRADVPALVARRALFVAGAAALLQGAAHVLNEIAFDTRFWHLDADSDWNALAWVASAVVLTAGLAAFVLGLAEPRRERLVLGAILALLALDEVVAWHERVALLVTEDVLGLAYGRARVVWPLALLPVLALVFVLLLRAARDAPAAARRSLVGGLALLVTAIALEAASTLIVDDPADERGWLYAIQVALEEGAELSGWILVIGGLVGGAYAAVAAHFARDRHDARRPAAITRA